MTTKRQSLNCGRASPSPHDEGMGRGENLPILNKPLVSKKGSPSPWPSSLSCLPPLRRDGGTGKGNRRTVGYSAFSWIR